MPLELSNTSFEIDQVITILDSKLLYKLLHENKLQARSSVLGVEEFCADLELNYTIWYIFRIIELIYKAIYLENTKKMYINIKTCQYKNLTNK
jgi:hypothetical protein